MLVDVQAAGGARHDREALMNSHHTETVDQAANSLLRMRYKVTPQRRAALAGLLVVTALGPAYRRPDGVQVVPITALGP